MGYGVSQGYGRGLGYGGGAKMLYITTAYARRLSGSAYIYENVGIAAPSHEDTDLGSSYIYENVGVALASHDQTDDINAYIYKDVQIRPAGSSEKITPTNN